MEQTSRSPCARAMMPSFSNSGCKSTRGGKGFSCAMAIPPIATKNTKMITSQDFMAQIEHKPNPSARTALVPL